MEHIFKRAKGVFDVLIHRRHFFFGINLRLIVFRRGPDGICLCAIRIQENLKILLLSRLLVDKADPAGLLHKYRNQSSFRLPFRGMGQPFPAVQMLF